MFRFLTRLIPVENTLPGRWARKTDPKYCEWWMKTQHPEPGYPNTYVRGTTPRESQQLEHSSSSLRAEFWIEFWSAQHR